DPVALTKRPGPGLCDLCFAEVVTHLPQGLGGGGDAADHHWKRGHEIDEPRKEWVSLQEVVVVLDQLRRWLKPLERLDLPVALGREPAPEPRARGEAIGGVGFEDEERVSQVRDSIVPACGRAGLASRPCGPSTSPAGGSGRRPRSRSRGHTGSRVRSPSTS